MMLFQVQPDDILSLRVWRRQKVRVRCQGLKGEGWVALVSMARKERSFDFLKKKYFYVLANEVREYSFN